MAHDPLGPDPERLAFLGTLAGGLAHEIKNPLSTMTITLGLLEEDLRDLGEPAERSIRRVKVLEREVAALERILHDFLQFAGRHRLDPRPTDLNALVSEVLDFVTPAALEAHVELRHHLSLALPPIPLDRERVRRALLNIVLNALDAMEGRQGELLVQSSVQGRAVRLDVTDTGPGIPRETLRRIFDAYYSSKARGTGLGLPIAKRIVEEHGGLLEVFTDEGRGTRFTLWFPIDAPEPTGPGEPPEPAPGVVEQTKEMNG